MSVAVTPDINFNGLCYVAQRKYINLNEKKFVVNLQNAITDIYPSIDQENLLKIMEIPDIYQGKDYTYTVMIGDRFYYHEFPAAEVCEGRYMAELVFTIVSYYIYLIHCESNGKEE